MRPAPVPVAPATDRSCESLAGKIRLHVLRGEPSIPQASTSNAPVLGVTGPIAAGKSELSRRLEALGARVIDVDALGREVLDSDDGKREVVREFGRGVVLGGSGALDRRALARVAFAEEAARRRLEAIVHPIVRRRIDEAVRRAHADAAPLVVVDCALLFESGLDAVCDATVDVDAPEPLRLARAESGRGWRPEETRRRASAQMSPDEKRSRADFVVVNDGDASRLDDEAKRLFDETVRRGAHARRGPRRTKR